MSNPYTSVAISGYNASPPDDDGSQVASNQVEWDKHKTKLGDPVKTLAESINTNVLAAFALTFGSGISSHATGYTVLTSDRGKFFEATAALTFTLPAASSAGEGFPLAFINTGSGAMTLDGNASETINGSTTLVVDGGGSAILTCNGTSWVAAVSGSATIDHSSVSSSSGTLSLDMQNQSVKSFYCLLTENITTITFSNVPSGQLVQARVRFEQDASTARTVTYSAGYRFPGGSDHVMSTGLSDVDIVTFETDNGGTHFDCTFRKNSA